MAFSGQEFLERHDPWAFIDTRGRRHVARDLGYRDGVRWLNRFEVAKGSAAAQEEVISRFVRVLFPAKLRYWFRRPWVAGCWITALVATAGWRRHVQVPLLVDLLLAAVVIVGSVTLLITNVGDPDPWIEFRRLPGPAQVEAIRDVFHRVVGTIASPPIPSSPSTPISSRSAPTRTGACASVA